MSNPNQLVYLPLGGAGEIGMNMYLYGFGPEKDRDWIVVDCGVSFGDMSSSPGIDLVMPDIEFIHEIAGRVKAIFITHAHEDHVGAVGHTWVRRGMAICFVIYGALLGSANFASGRV